MEDFLVKAKEEKAKWVNEQVEGIKKSFLTASSVSRTSCSRDGYGWSAKEHQWMSSVADEMRKLGVSVSSKVNHEITDWLFTA